MIRNFNEVKERNDQQGNEWQYGAIAVDLAAIPASERLTYLPKGVLQNNEYFDTNGCASRAPLNIYETKLDYFYDHGMHPALQQWCNDNGYRVNGKFALNDAFIEILSGTTKNGNSLKATVDAIRKYGVIPASMLEPLESFTSWEEYMNPARITKECKKMGEEFMRRFTFNYEQVPLSRFPEALQDDLLDVAGYAWPKPKNGVYPATEGQFNHAFMCVDVEINAFDNYEPFVKLLDKKYKFFEWGYSFSITAQNPYPNETITLFETLKRLGLLAFFAEALSRLLQVKPEPMPPKPIEPVPPLHIPVDEPKPPVVSKREELYNLAKKCLGKDIAATQNELGCAEAMSFILRGIGKILPKGEFLSTSLLDAWLQKNATRITEPLPGDIVMYATGTSTKGAEHGHVLVQGYHGLMSNNSLNGLWEQTHTTESAKTYYETKLGFPPHYYRV